LYSILTIKLNKKDPYEMLVKILKELPNLVIEESWEGIADLILKYEGLL